MMTTRRNFIKHTSILAGLYPLNSQLRFAAQYKVGLIGCGWYGKSDLMRLIQVADVEVVALCDVDKEHLREAAQWCANRQKSGRTPRQYGDYQKMLEKENLDLVLIGSPDHWHALHAIHSLEAGAHLYLQKPISTDVLEGKAILEKAKETQKVVQIGLQRRSTPHLIEAKQNIVEAGLLGKVAKVEMCCYYHMRKQVGHKTIPIPDHLDFEEWCGPAPRRPFVELPHRGYWRAMMEYSNGIMGDMCVHMLDAVRWMLGLGWPEKISSEGGIYVQKDSAANTPDTQSALFHFGDLVCSWNHRSWGTPPDPDYPWAFFIYGDRGTLKADVFKYEFIPVDGSQTIRGNVLYEREKYPEDVAEKNIEIHTAPATRRQLQNWIASLENGSSPRASIEEGYISTASCILANIAMRRGRPLVFDPQNTRILNDPLANDLLARDYRPGWSRP